MHECEYEDESTDKGEKLFKSHSADCWELLEEEIPDWKEKTIVQDHEYDQHDKTDAVFHCGEEIVFVKWEEGFHMWRVKY